MIWAVLKLREEARLEYQMPQIIKMKIYICTLFILAEITAFASTKEDATYKESLYRSPASSTTTNRKDITRLRQKRQDTEPYYPDYPDYPSYPGYPYSETNGNGYPEQGSNYLVPAGIVGGTGLVLKAAKTKAKLKALFAIPAGLALLGGIAALASGLIPPAVIGGINLPFQGKRRKRHAEENLNLENAFENKLELVKNPHSLQKLFQNRYRSILE